jgi:hypothetical protein
MGKDMDAGADMDTDVGLGTFRKCLLTHNYVPVVIMKYRVIMTISYA